MLPAPRRSRVVTATCGAPEVTRELDVIATSPGYVSVRQERPVARLDPGRARDPALAQEERRVRRRSGRSSVSPLSGQPRDREGRPQPTVCDDRRAEKREVVGWGYEGQSVEDLLAFTRRNGVRTVVDVRLNAISRKVGFSKRQLQARLASAGVDYVHLPALGNPKDNREGFASPESASGQQAHARFIRDVLEVAEARGALDKVTELTTDGPVAILCFEADERCCHRSLVLAALTLDPVAV